MKTKEEIESIIKSLQKKMPELADICIHTKYKYFGSMGDVPLYKCESCGKVTGGHPNPIID